MTDVEVEELAAEEAEAFENEIDKLQIEIIRSSDG